MLSASEHIVTIRIGRCLSLNENFYTELARAQQSLHSGLNLPQNIIAVQDVHIQDISCRVYEAMHG